MQKTEMSFFRDKRILITGHTGFKGSWLSRILIDAGAKVTGVSLEPPTSPSIFSICRLENQMDSVIGDVRDFELLKEVFERVQPQIVIHLAAQPIVRESYKNPRETYETNVMGTVNILECARQFSCVRSFLNVTTDKVYENKEWEWGYREEDVLDTWFSSALWPFSTLGWPNKDSEDLRYWYPTSVLVTGYDIIFFWVARMIFSGMEQMKQEPFKTVFIHGLVRDDKGRKMSKSLGNGIDPLEMADKFGADALRFNLITGNSPGNDMRFFVEKCEAMRNFANKIWNASRYVMMNLTIDHVQLPEQLELEDKWVLSKLNTLIREVTDNMEAYELGVASAKIYDFIWDTYCDWYIELTKARLYGEDEEAKLAAQNVLCYVLLRVLELLHPFMPFITEEIWQALPHEGDFLIRAQWPEYQERFAFTQEENAMEAVKDAISAVRARRSEMNVPPSRKAKILIVTQTPDIYAGGRDFIMRLAYASEVEVQAQSPEDLKGMVTVATHNATLYLPLAELVDIQQELERIAKEKTKAEENLARIEKKLQNESFVSKAPEAVVNAEREKADKARALIAKLEESAAAMRG